MGLLSKLFNTFKRIRLNNRNAVVGQSLDYLLLSSLYAEQQSAYLNSYETGLPKSTLIEILEEYSAIYNKEQALTVLQDLKKRNTDANLEIVFSAFDNKDNAVEILKRNLPNDEYEFKLYIAMYRSLNTIVDELIAENIITHYSQISSVKDSAFDYGKGAFLARCCFELGYLSENEMKLYLEESYYELKTVCSTWSQYVASYVLGRAIWGGSHNSGMIQIGLDLLHHKKSPLKDKTYL